MFYLIYVTLLQTYCAGTDRSPILAHNDKHLCLETQYIYNRDSINLNLPGPQKEHRDIGIRGVTDVIYAATEIYTGIMHAISSGPNKCLPVTKYTT